MTYSFFSFLLTPPFGFLSVSPLLHFLTFLSWGKKHAVDASWREHPEAPERSAFVSSGPRFPECSGKSALLITSRIIFSFFNLYIFFCSVSLFCVSLRYKSNKNAAFHSPLLPCVCVRLWERLCLTEHEHNAILRPTVLIALEVNCLHKRTREGAFILCNYALKRQDKHRGPYHSLRLNRSFINV